MNCAEFEQLLDAYLDDELSGSLRLEFDAHRLRCRRCRLTIAMMESVGSVVATDRRGPTLSDDFADRVMGQIERRPVRLRVASTRVALVAGALFQAAAVVALAIWLPRGTNPPPGMSAAEEARPSRATSSAEGDVLAELDAEYADVDARFALREAIYDDIVRRVEAARANWVSDFSQLARYASAWSVSEEVTRASDGLTESSPLGILLEALLPQQESGEGDSQPMTADQHLL